MDIEVSDALISLHFQCCKFNNWNKCWRNKRIELFFLIEYQSDFYFHFEETKKEIKIEMKCTTYAHSYNSNQLTD